MKLFWIAVTFAFAFQGTTIRQAAIEGTVVRSSNAETVAGAAVELWQVGSGQSDAKIVVADSKGKFRFADIAAGEYRLTATHLGYVRAEYGQRGPNTRGLTLLVGEGRELRDLSITLTETAAIYGRVYDRIGMALPNVQVQALRFVYSESEGRRKLDTLKAVVTNDLGEYRLFWLPPGQYYVSATAFPGSMPDTVAIPLGGGGAAMAMLPPPAGALIEVPDKASGLPFYYPSTINLNAAQAIELRPGDNHGGVDFHIDAANTHGIRGVVINRPSPESAGGQGFVQVRLMPRGKGPSPTTFSTTGVDPKTGIFEIRNVPPGEYYLLTSVTFSPNTNVPFLFSRLSIDVLDKNIDGVAVRLEQGWTIPIHVSIEGRPVDDPGLKQIRVNLVGQAQPSAQPGVFLASNVPPGEHRLSMIDLPRGGYIKSGQMGGRDILTEGFTLGGQSDPPQTIEVVIGTQGATLEGVVTNNRQEPQANITVAIVPDRARRKRSDLYKAAFTDRAGLFRITGIAPGEYSVFAWESVETGMWKDAEFLAPYESQGSRVRVTENSLQTLQLPVASPPR